MTTKKLISHLKIQQHIFIKIAALMLVFTTTCADAQVLDKEKILNAQRFWHNQDWEWYKSNIPFFKSPDKQLDQTYYYRWDMLTSHMVYGSPKTGYTFTEFIDRPWWSGRYGAISCAAGHQLYETRWLRNPVYATDFANYWFNTEGSNLRNYTSWIADAIWQLYEVQYNKPNILSLKNSLVENYKGWEKEHWIADEGMFAWDGMHDGMETNINSRQTPQWFEGAPGYRPTLNSYMWADAMAISRIATLAGDPATSKLFKDKAAGIKSNFQQKNWDPSRNFFFHRYLKDEPGGIKANTLTYQTGKYAGNKHGREEIGFIPWYFNMPDKGYEAAFQYLTDTAYFHAPYGPRTVEKHDPLFLIAPKCCAWSGNSWPYATTQTLKAMANLIRNYQQHYITKKDYFNQLQIFSATQRKDGVPFIGEGNNPETGSWDGHDYIGHSEHYFHSAFIDEVITGLMGFKPSAVDSVEVNPLIPDEWDYAALDNIRYHGHDISIIWDKNGNQFNKGKGLSIWSDGKIIASAPGIKQLKAYLKPAEVNETQKRLVNYAVNNEPGNYFPHMSASFPGVGKDNVDKMNDGQYWYYTTTTNRWSSLYDADTQHWIEVDFGVMHPVKQLKIYLVEAADISMPKAITIQYYNGKTWMPLKTKNDLEKLQPNSSNTLNFSLIHARKFRIMLKSQTGKAVAVSELEAWGPRDSAVPVQGQQQTIRKTSGIAASAMVSASFTSKFDNIKAINDGIINPASRWTAYGSPNKTDTLTFNFNKVQTANAANLYFYSDKGEVQPPQQYWGEFFNGSKWLPLQETMRAPDNFITEGLNILNFKPVQARKIRFIFKHQSPRIFTGLYEIEMMNKVKK